MGPEESRALVQWAGQSFPTAAWLNYDPIRPHDAFGQVMVENLKVNHKLNKICATSTGQHSPTARPDYDGSSLPLSGAAAILLAFTAAPQWRRRWRALQKAGGRRRGAKILVKYTPASQHKTCAGLFASRAHLSFLARPCKLSSLY